MRNTLVTLIQMSSIHLRYLPHEPIPETEAHLIFEITENGRPHAEPYVILQDVSMWDDWNHANWPDGNVWVKLAEEGFVGYRQAHQEPGKALHQGARSCVP